MGILFGAGCHKDKPPDYLKKIPQFGIYEYRAATTPVKKSDAAELVLSHWIDPDNPNSFGFAYPFDMAPVDSMYWITDPINGEVYEFNRQGKFRSTIVTNGSGPNQVIRPTALDPIGSKDEKSLVFILDSGRKSIVIFDQEGKETGRISHKSIPAGIPTWVRSLPNNRLAWPTYQSPKHIIAETTSNAARVSYSVPRLIPVGHQPITHNYALYDYNDDLKIEIYAYSGLPILFLQDNGINMMYNLLPYTELEEINTPLDQLPPGTRVTVNHLHKDLFIDLNKAWILFSDLLVVIDLETFGIRKYTLTDVNGRSLQFHKMVDGGETLFFINRFTHDFYLISKSSVLH